MITTILTSYKRPQTLNRQIDAIKNQTIKSTDIMVWHNESGVPFIKPNHEDVKTIVSNHNFKYHGRFALGLLARTEYVAIFDDDTIPGNKWFENCINTMKTTNSIMGTIGIYLKGDIYRNHVRYGWAVNNRDVPTEVDLVGHAWFFKREWLKYMWMEPPINWENGEDIQFSYMALKHGGIKTFVPPHPKNNMALWGSDIKTGRTLGADANCSISTNKNHTSQRDDMIRTYRKDGWKTVRMRNI